MLRNHVARVAAVRTGPGRLGSTPRRRVRFTRSDVRWDTLVARELPDRSAGTWVNEERVHRTAGSVKPGTKCGRRVILITTPSIGTWRARTAFVHKVGADRRLRNGIGIARGGGAGMQGKLIVCGIVYTLDDIDLATFGPVGTNGPHGRPNTAAKWHLRDIEQDQTSRVSILARDTHAVAICTGGKPIGVVYLHGDYIVLHIGEPLLRCGGCRNVIHLAVGRIRRGEKGEVVEKRASRHVLREFVLPPRDRRLGGCGGGGGGMTGGTGGSGLGARCGLASRVGIGIHSQLE